jgi:ribosomal protein S18 acetylase RimI-like enzyme
MEGIAMLIKIMEEEDISNVLAVAESAFSDEKLYKWIVPDTNERSVFIKEFFRFRLRSGFGKRQMEVVVDDSAKIMGMAIWDFPVENKNNDKENSPDTEKFLSQFNNTIRERCYKFIGTVIEAENFFPRPYWALSPIFIRKEMQGKGIASLLIRRQLKIIDDSRLPCILVAQEENNISIYERYGFKVGIEIPIDIGITSYGMIRK